MDITQERQGHPYTRSGVGTRQRVSILGMGIDQVDAHGAAARLHGFVEAGGAHQVVTVNLDFLSIGLRDRQFRALVNGAALAVADGVPVLWAARYLGSRLPARITGPDLIQMAVTHSQAHGSSLFFLGAAPGVARAAAERLRFERGPFRLAGVDSPPFGPFDISEDARVRRLLADARPDFLFVAFGCPKQDFWIRDHADLEVPVAAGIGGSFDYLSGAIRRAPRWAQRSGLEWAFRLRAEPRRLAKRYFVDDVPVLGKLLLSRFVGPHEAVSGEQYDGPEPHAARGARGRFAWQRRARPGHPGSLEHRPRAQDAARRPQGLGGDDAGR
jgi:N-acetylglucosaminyldiphosphoundecaprenol N-acetyl-beta-D-mannosaminyltransferase